jgi:hypothetical protein
MKVYFYLLENMIEFSLSKHHIKYEMEGKQKTYNPDIVIKNIIYEIKPQKLINLKNNIAKRIALENYCDKFNLKCDYITENTYNCDFINKEYIEDKLEKGILILDEKQEKRLNRIMRRKYFGTKERE